MEKYNRLWRFFFAVSLAALAIQQLICADFRPVIMPPSFPAWLPARLIWTWIFSVALIAATSAIIFEIKARRVSVILGSVLLVFFLIFQVPYQVSQYPLQLGAWTSALKELALSGSALIVAGSLPREANTPGFIRQLEKLVPAGKYFFGIMFVVFGIDHFLYTDFVAGLIPNWIPDHLFWTYFAGLALSLSGIAIILNIKMRLAAGLLGLMVFIWFIILHIPRAVTDPHSGHGNEWTSVFEALAYSGIAFILAARSQYTADTTNA